MKNILHRPPIPQNVHIYSTTMHSYYVDTMSHQIKMNTSS